MPYDGRSRALWARGEHALIGVSPGNGYFSQDRLTMLASWAGSAFERVDFVCADAHVAATFAALNHSGHDARRRARKEIKNVWRRIGNAIRASGVPVDRFDVRGLSEFLGTPPTAT
ncbi:tRNA-dependent cyclodipeptide synthase [Actinokineospora sp. 24-640]